ncbi:hypothetical protein AB834_03335 [PVC group bacterium (ex Bugula neritina AB1)]|nr:hypothetical protein AB834_03335 [PVC group bacterium (ex Bugula neritina AB1)]
MKSLITIFICGFFSLSLFAKTEEILLTAYYPAPFGDFEHIRTNSMEFLGVFHGATYSGQKIIKGATKISDLKFIDVYRGFKILGEFLDPYRKDPSLPLSKFALYTSDKVLFNENGGVFSKNARNGLMWDVSEGKAMLRSEGKVIVEPGYTGDDSDYVLKNGTFMPKESFEQKKLVIRGDVQIVSPDGDLLFEVTSNFKNGRKNPLIRIFADVQIMKGCAIKNKLHVEDNLTVNKDINLRGDFVGEGDLGVKGMIRGNFGEMKLEKLTVGKIYVTNQLYATSIQSRNSSSFFIKVDKGGGRGGIIAKFHKGTGRGADVALIIPGQVKGRYYGKYTYLPEDI